MFDFLRARRRVLWLAAASAATVLLASCGGGDAAKPARFGTTVVFGASGTDTGNRCGVAADPLCFPVPPYAGASSATNGKLFSELVAENYGGKAIASSAGGTNYAVGGAQTGVIPGDTTPLAIASLQAQAELYLQRVNYQISPQTLVIVDGSAFGNNIRRSLQLAAANPAQGAAIAQSTVTQGATDIFSLVLRLYSAGARHILLANSSDLGLHPAVRAAGAQAIGTATAMADGYNGALAAQVVPQLRATLSGINIYTVDFGQLSKDIVATPAAFGLSNTALPCYPFFSAPTAPVCATPALFVWWDELHPSAAVHAIVAQRAIAAIGS